MGYTDLSLNGDGRVGGVEDKARCTELGDEDIGAEVGGVEYDLARLSVGGNAGHHAILVAFSVEGELLEVDEVVGEEVSATILDRFVCLWCIISVAGIGASNASKEESGAIAVHAVQSVHRDISDLECILNLGLRVDILSDLELRAKRIGGSQVAT